MIRMRVGVVALLALLPAFAVAGPTATADAALPHAATAGPGVYTVTGRVVRFGNGRPVRNARVEAYDAGETDFLGADLTDAQGRFVIRGVRAQDNEFGIYVRGKRIGLQNGWLGCNRTLFPTFGEACTVSTPVGKIRVKAH